MNMSACSTCGKSVKDISSIKSNLCLIKVHLKCNCLNYVDSQYIMFSNKTWHCFNCSTDLLPFTIINNFKLSPLLSDKIYCQGDSHESCLALKPPKNLSNLMNLIPSHLISVICQKILILTAMVLINWKL